MNQSSPRQQTPAKKKAGFLRKFWDENRLMVVVTCVFLLVLVLGAWWFYSEWKCTGGDLKSKEQLTKTFHDLGVLVGGFIAIWVAIWRSDVASRQARALKEQVTALKEQVTALKDQAKHSQDQVEASQDQAITSQQGLLNERYQKGAEMLGSEVLSVRLGGIYALRRLAQEDKQMHYKVQIIDLFCAFVRNPTEDAALNRDRIREDVDVTLKAIIKCRGSAPERLSLTNARMLQAGLVYRF